jgi:hypothetical protein
LLRRIGALDHDTAAMPDILMEARSIGVGNAARSEAVVEAVQQVRRSIDERSVEVEDDDGFAHEVPGGIRWRIRWR